MERVRRRKRKKIVAVTTSFKSFSLAPFKDLRLVPADHTMQVIGTVHTHYATVPPAQRDSGGTTTYSIHPGVSDKDKNSAKVDKIVIGADGTVSSEPVEID